MRGALSFLFLLVLSCSCNSLPYHCETPCPPAEVQVVNDCDFRGLITQHEMCCLCAYLDSAKPPNPTIGIGFNLNVESNKQQIINLGLDFDKVYDGTQCLTVSQVDTLFQYSFKIAMQSALKDVPTFDSLCCNAQLVIIDMEFNLYSLAAWPTFRGYIAEQQWDLASKDLLYGNPLWCGQVKSRCTNDGAILDKGCPCFGSYPAACSGPTCCQSASQCCATVTSSKWTHQVPVIECCNNEYPICCGPTTSGCCPKAFENCCQNLPGGCCQTGYPVCCSSLSNPDGWCCAYSCGPNNNCYSATGDIVATGAIVHKNFTKYV